MKDIKIEHLKTSDLIPYINNARKHSPEQISTVAASIKEFGFINPVLIDKDNTIIAGHCRVLSAKKLKIKEIPCLRVDHLTPAQQKAYILADNRLAETSEWDAEILKIELESLAELDYDLEVLNMDDAFLSGMDIDLSLDGSGDTNEDFTPNIPDQNNEFKEDTEFCLKIDCNSDDERQNLFEELNNRGIKVKAI